ncbi:MAG: hypothetical protein Q8882_01115, partial [Bacillota bacterium]|nr:hypothetical protein [Bacillota bacterium]
MVVIRLTVIYHITKELSRMKKEFGEYYLGLDIGTDSIGWAVTDKEYNLKRFNGNDMWGIHLFN